MGKNGTDVAKNASDMILTDDNFVTIIEAVKEGRHIYSNIKKAIHFLIATNVGEIITIFLGLVLGLETPLLAIHLLWINLVTDSFPAIALGLEPMEPGIMKQKPIDSKKGIFADGMWEKIFTEGAMIGILTLVAFSLGNYLYVPVRDIPESKNKDLKDHISSIIGIADEVRVVRSYAVKDFDQTILTLITKQGVVKNTLLSSYKVTRYSKPITAIKLKSGDELINVSVKEGKEFIVVTKKGMCLKFNSDEIPVLGLKASGVKGIKLNDGDEVINGLTQTHRRAAC